MRSMIYLALMGLPNLALAVDVDPFEPAGSLAHGNGGLATENATLAGPGIAFGLMGFISNDLMVIRFPSSGNENPYVENAFGTTLYAGYTYEDKFRVEFFAPVYLGVNAPGVSYRGAALGDMVLQGNIPIWQLNDAFNLSVLPGFGLPTGSKQALMHQGVSGRVKVAMSGTFDFGLGYAANLGTALTKKSAVQGVSLGSTFDLQTAVWYAPTTEFRIGAEYDSRFSMVGNNHVAEGRIFAQVVSPDGVAMTVGGGRGLIAGVGAPDYRVFGAVTYGPTARDRDKDGILDRDDLCPKEPEDFDGFEDIEGCPDPDNDQDSILDADDACPMEPEDFDNFEDEDGCPDTDNDQDGLSDTDDRCPDDAGPEDTQGCPDSDEDGIVDIDDQCPSQPGITEFNGCPDTDVDRVPDYRDVCPDEKGPEDEDPAVSDGCPKEAYVTRDRIKFNQRILFEWGKDIIKTQSYGILDAIASIMASNPHVNMVEVAGHTDDDGPDDFNMDLSNRRAASVKNYLTQKGIEESRLTSQGYGETEPMDSNRTEFGRANNRRVEFRILEQGEPEVRERSISENMSFSWLSIQLPESVTGYLPVTVDGQELPHQSPIDRMLVEPGQREITVVGKGWSHSETIEVERAQIYTIIVPDSAVTDTKTSEPAAEPDAVIESELPLAIPAGEEGDLPKEEPAPEDEPSSTDEPAVEEPQLEEPVIEPAVEEPAPEPKEAEVAPSVPSVTGPSDEPQLDPAMGSLSIFLEGNGNAAVFVDGVELDVTAPLQAFELSPGPHAVRVVNEDRGLNHIEVVQVVAGQNVSISLKLEPLPEPPAPEPTEEGTPDADVATSATDSATDKTAADSGKKKKKKKKAKKKKSKQKTAEPATESSSTEEDAAPEPEPAVEEPAPAEPATEAPASDDPWGAETEEAPSAPTPEGGNDDDPWSPEKP